MFNLAFFLSVFLCLSGFAKALPITEHDDFDTLMGKYTSNWRYLEKPVEIETYEKFRSLYDKHKYLRFSTHSSSKIPKVAHFIWLGPKPFPPQSVQNIRSWMARHPDWTFKFWTDRERTSPCNGMQVILVNNFNFSQLKRCFEGSQNWGEQSDILRYEILYQEGGVFIDHNVSCLSSFEGLHLYDFYCCLEPPHPVMGDRNLTVGNALIGSRRLHPLMKNVMDLIESRWDELGRKFRGNDGYHRNQVVIERTYLALTHAVELGIAQGGNEDIVLPAAFFFAKNMPSLYSKHFFANSMANEAEKNAEILAKKTLHEILQKSKKIQRAVLGILLLSLLMFPVVFILLKRNLKRA